MIAPKGDVVLCMRTVSDRPHTLKSGEEGYFHKLDSTVTAKRCDCSPRRPDPVINVGKMMGEWISQTGPGMMEDLAERLSVGASSLKVLGCAWAAEHGAWAFPMKDGYGNLTGIRLRTNDGHKFAVRGSHQGVFLPNCDTTDTVLVCEGPTDTAAAITLGFYAIGRPSCAGGVADVVAALRRLKVRRAVIVSDSDEVGSRGAGMLQKHLPMPSALIVLPAKDIREFLRLGGTRDLLQTMINNLIWEAK